MKEEVKELWKVCFTDSEAFTDLYFRLRYTDDINLAIHKGNRLISALQMIPYPMTFCGHTVQTSYISGACTHPEFRGHGSMRKLLSQAFVKMFNQQIYFTTLIPAESWLFDYYAQSGYASVFQYAVKHHIISGKSDKFPSHIQIQQTKDAQEATYEYLSRKLSERRCCIQHTLKDFQIIMADLKLSDGILFTIRQDNIIRGIAIVYQGNPYPTIQELLADNEKYKQILLQAISQQSSSHQLNEICPPIKSYPLYPLGMARIIHAHEVLKLYALFFPEKERCIHLTDNELTENNGYYHLYRGDCVHSQYPQSLKYHPMNIRQLTEQTLLPLHPYMSLMLN